jgi:formate/nitrite transporter FocA (FNT family)
LAVVLPIVLPICAFVALGFGHSLANMNLAPDGWPVPREFGASGFIGTGEIRDRWG